MTWKPRQVVTSITQARQGFVDVPQYRTLKPLEPSGTEQAVRKMFEVKSARPLQELTHYVRHRLKWIKPRRYTFADLTEQEREQLRKSPLTRDSEHEIVKHMIEKRGP